MTINGSTNSSNWTYKLEAYETSYSIENNTSVVRVDMYIGRASTRSYLGGNYNASIVVDGQTQSFSGNIPYPTYINGGDWYYLATKDYTIYHNADGSKIAHVTAEMTSGDFTPSYCNASGDLTLTTIPRASTITATSAYIEETSQLTINRKSNQFTHSIEFAFGNLSGYILADGTITSTETKITATSIGFPIPSTFYAQIPNSMEGSVALAIKTYNGNTQIGSTQTTTFVARVNPSTNAPSVTISVVDTNQDTIALTGDSSIIVTNESLVSATWSATAKHNSSITSVKIYGLDATQSPFTFQMGINTISILAIDSRGLTTTIYASCTYKDYSYPNSIFNVERVAPTSDYAYMTFNGNWWNNNFGDENNTLSISWYYRQKNTQNWTLGGNLVENTDYTISNNTFYSGTGQSASALTIGGNLVYANAWDFKLVVTDSLKTIEIIATMPQGIPIVNWDGTHFNINGDVTQNELPLRNCCVATLLSKQTISQQYINIALSHFEINTGNFTISNLGEIIIGDDVKKIRVSGNIFIEDWVGGSNYCWGKICINDVEIATTILSVPGYYMSLSIPSTIIQASKNDKIKLLLDSPTNNCKVREYTENTWLCIEKVE